MPRARAIVVLIGLQVADLLGSPALAASPVSQPRRRAALAAVVGLGAAATFFPEAAQGALGADPSEALRTIGDGAQATYQSLRPIASSLGDVAMSLFAGAARYAHDYPAYAAADAVTGTVAAGVASLAGRTIKLGVGVGLFAAGLVAAGALEPAAVQLATEHAAQAAAGVLEAARHASAAAVETLREAPWHQRALAQARGFVATWGDHATQHLGMTALFTTTGLAFGRQAIAGVVTAPFRLWRSKER